MLRLLRCKVRTNLLSEIVKKEKLICADFAVVSQSAKVISTVPGKCCWQLVAFRLRILNGLQYTQQSFVTTVLPEESPLRNNHLNQ